MQNAEPHECHRKRESHDQENDCHECETLHFKKGKVTFSHLVQLAEGSLPAKGHCKLFRLVLSITALAAV